MATQVRSKTTTSRAKPQGESLDVPLEELTLVIPVLDAGLIGPEATAAKIATSSLLRTFFPGRILLAHNQPRRLFLTERAAVAEAEIPGVSADERSHPASGMKALREWLGTVPAACVIVSPYTLAVGALSRETWSVAEVPEVSYHAVTARWAGTNRADTCLGLVRREQDLTLIQEVGEWLVFDPKSLGVEGAVRRMFGLYMETFYGDGTHVLVNALEF